MSKFKTQVSRRHYFKKKYENLSRFISYYHQIDTIRTLEPKSLLEIGKGNGLVSDYFKRLGTEVKTVDFDESLKSDYIADVRELPIKENSFDIVVAFEILEHIPFTDFKKALRELKRVSKKNVIISVPYRSTGFEFVFKFPLIRTIFKKDFINLFLRLPLKFGGIETSGQHYWEIDSSKYGLKKVRAEIKKVFKIKKEIRPVLDHYHYFFVLEKK